MSNSAERHTKSNEKKRDKFNLYIIDEKYFPKGNFQVSIQKEISDFKKEKEDE